MKLSDLDDDTGDFANGYRAYFSNAFLRDCPHEHGSYPWFFWREGWIAACKTGV